ncbi:MAG TPA: HNH endonuclease signature motif containing protein [Gemmatimonadaceae bacterium]
MKREAIFARDGYRCVFCGEAFPADQLSVDHLQARSRGGDRSSGNLVTACRACNARKGRQRLAGFLASDRLAYASFQRLAVHAWKRHLSAIDDEVRKIRSTAARDD